MRELIIVIAGEILTKVAVRLGVSAGVLGVGAGTSWATLGVGLVAAKYGEEVAVTAAKKVGPRLFRLVEEVGEDEAPRALKSLARRGDEAVWVVARPKSFALFAKYGDSAADAMIRHREISDPLIENYGMPMVRALTAVDGRNGRRLAMLADDGILTKLPQRDDVLNTIGKYGDRAADWVWRNKAAITTVAVAAAFVNDPEPFINGAVEVVDIGGEKVIRPVAEAAARSLNWNLIIAVPVTLLVLLIILRVLVNMRHTGFLRGRPPRMQSPTIPAETSAGEKPREP